MSNISEWLHLQFLWWWMLFLLPLPWLIWKFITPLPEQAELHLAYLPEQQQQAPTVFSHKILAVVIWVTLIIACARPVWVGDPVTFQPKYRDLMLVVDLSGSMSIKDMKHHDDYIDRLSAVKQVLSDFVKQRQGDRLGTVLFADHAYLQTPLTADRKTVINQINQTVIGLVGSQTAIGDGIGLATKTFVDSNAPQRVMILLSDGSNNAGVLNPIEAAKIAKKYHATIYTVGVGAGEMQVQDFFSTRTVNTAADLDEKTLHKIATMTGGQYFRARNANQLKMIYQEINKLEPVSTTTQTWRPQDEWFKYPLTCALLCSILLFVLKRKY